MKVVRNAEKGRYDNRWILLFFYFRNVGRLNFVSDQKAVQNPEEMMKYTRS